MSDLNGAYTSIESLVRLRFAAKDFKLAPKRHSRALLAGEGKTRFRGRGMEFEEVRVYQAGDDIRSIDWRVTARTQVPHTKLFREERERPTFIVADQRSSLFFGAHRFKSVLAARLAASIGWAAHLRGDRVGGLVFGDEDHRDCKPQRNKKGILGLIHHLEKYNHKLHSPIAPKASMSLRNLLEDTRRLAKPGSAVTIVSDFQDLSAEHEESLFQLARHTEVSLLAVYDPIETQLPNHGLFSISNGQQRLQLPADNRKVRALFEQQFQERQTLLQTMAGRCKIDLSHFSTDDDELNQLRQQCPSRGRS